MNVLLAAGRCFNTIAQSRKFVYSKFHSYLAVFNFRKIAVQLETLNEAKPKLDELAKPAWIHTPSNFFFLLFLCFLLVSIRINLEAGCGVVARRENYYQNV